MGDDTDSDDAEWDDAETDDTEKSVRQARGAGRTAQADPADGSADDSDLGWGERPDESSPDEWYLRERPPHHGG